jgi:uncharacterized protein YqjF (DUF2071 family)
MDRPSLPAFLRETWRDAFFLHWPIPADALRPHVPARLAIDRFDGKAWVSVVALRLENARLALVPRRLGLGLLEVGTRTYVHVDGEDPGVYFFSLDTTSLLATALLRLTEALPVQRARIAHRHEDGRLTWRMEMPDSGFSAVAQLGGREGAAEPDSLAHFLVERYFVHAVRAGTLWTTRVHHAPFDLSRARVLELDERLLAPVALPEREGSPLVHYAAETEAEVFLPRIRL